MARLLKAFFIVSASAVLLGCETIFLSPEPEIHSTEWGQITVWHYPPGYNSSSYGYRELWAKNTSNTPYCVVVARAGGKQLVTAPANTEKLLLGRGQVPEGASVDWMPGSCEAWGT